MKILIKFKQFISSITLKDIIYWLLIFVFFSFMSIAINKCASNNKIYEKNIDALTDTIKLERNKNNQLIASKQIFDSNMNDLKKLNKDLYKEINKLNIKNRDLISAINMKGEIDYGQNDTIYEIKYDTIYKGFTKDFCFNNKWRELSGIVKYDKDILSVNINKDIVNFDYTLGIDKNNRVYVTSSNPYVKYNELSGFTIPKQKKYRFSFGPSVGTGYGLINNKFDIYLGISANWSIIKW